jgi:hypothetical protein
MTGWPLKIGRCGHIDYEQPTTVSGSPFNSICNWGSPNSYQPLSSQGRVHTFVLLLIYGVSSH